MTGSTSFSPVRCPIITKHYYHLLVLLLLLILLSRLCCLFDKVSFPFFDIQLPPLDLNIFCFSNHQRASSSYSFHFRHLSFYNIIRKFLLRLWGIRTDERVEVRKLLVLTMSHKLTNGMKMGRGNGNTTSSLFSLNGPG